MKPRGLMKHRWAIMVAVVLVAAMAACAPADEQADDNTLTIAVVDNPDLVRMQELASHFTDQHPEITLEWVTLSEGELRQKVSTDVGSGAGQYDVVALGAYETAIWAERDLLVPMDGLDPSYDVDDLLPTVRQALSYEGQLFALPFYAESSFTMYRTDLLEEAGLRMPDNPTWDFVVQAAQRMGDLGETSGACLRGVPGWGENMALVTTMANAYGGRWFDEQWQPQLTSEAWQQALQTYLALGAEAPDGAVERGFSENAQLFADGKCAIWVDSTAAAAQLADPDRSSVADTVGFAPAPTAGHDRNSAWLWAWSLAVPASSQQQDVAKQFASWATSTEYTELVAEQYGWVNAPPGTRSSLYERSDYTEAADFADLVLQAISQADLDNPTVEPVPYTGIQYVAIPEFQGIGTAVGNQVAEALTGQVSAQDALQNSQWVTEKVIQRTRLTNDDQ